MSTIPQWIPSVSEVSSHLKEEARGLAGSYPHIYLPIARFQHRRNVRAAARDPSSVRPNLNAPVGSDTDIVIEGFPRSGNSFAVAAFEQAQPRPVVVAHHRHVPAQVLGAVRMGIPALVLVRDPEDAVLSLLIREPTVSPSKGLRQYVRFYRPLMPHRDYFVTATFDQVTTDFGAVIARVNARFGTDFALFEHTSTNVEKCFELIRRQNMEVLGNGSEFRSKAPVPSVERDRIKDAQRALLFAPEAARGRTAASRVYEELCDLASTQTS